MEQELNQGGVAQEQPKEDTSKAASDATSTEEKATSQRSEVEFRKLQSMKDKAEAQAKTRDEALQTVQRELQELRNNIERQKLERQQGEIDALAGDPDAQSRLRKIYQREKDAVQAEENLKKKDAGLTGKWNQAIDLAKEYSLYDAIEDLLAAESPKEMELLAKVKAAEKEKGQAKPQAGTSGFSPDSGASDAGGDSDEAFQKAWNAGDLPATKENLARAQKIVSK